MNPLLLKAIGIFLLLSSVAGASFYEGHKVGANGVQVEWDKDKSAQSAAVIAAQNKADAVKTLAANSMAELATAYEGKQANEKITTDRIIADLRNGVAKLRVSATYTCSSTVPAPATSAGGSNDKTTAAISGSVASRLAGRYADYNQVVEQLNLCQDIIKADRLEINGE